MAKRIIYSLFFLALFIILPVTIQAQLPPHDSSNGIVCRDCHYFTQQNGILIITVPRGAEQEAVCKSCHNPDGQASSMSSVGNHLVNGGDTIIECTSCHNPHRPDTTIDPHTGIEAPNLKLIRKKTRRVDGALELAVFQERPANFAFDEDSEPWNGICQTCHTETNYHTNDNTGDHSHFTDTACTSCHPHEEGFMPGGGTCGSCHGTYPDGITSPNTAGSHATHFDAGYGPHIQGSYCQDCHPNFGAGKHINGIVSFASGVDSNGNGNIELDETDVCDLCHSSDGTYDGVNDLTIGAKSNWVEGVYAENALKQGKEKWCAGCHDNEPANSMSDGTGVDAPRVVGDEEAFTDYGTGYGFYMTGHGLPATESYPASGSPGAGLSCTDCHDPATVHIDEIARTYTPDPENDYSNNTPYPESANYQNGYRLKDIATGYDGKYPMHIPRTGHLYPPGFREDWEFALCFQCHEKDKLFNGGDPTTGEGAETNFRAVTTGAAGNPGPTLDLWYSMHDVHTWGANGPLSAETPQYDSDYDGIADSRISCPACHNVHGSPSPAMIRHGELISTPGTTDKVPSFDFQYLPEGTYPMLTDSDGGTTRFIGAGPGSVAKNGICNMCHNDQTMYYRISTNAPGPRISNRNPVNGALNVSLDSNLTFSLSENMYGVDWTTFSIELSGDKGYSNTYTDEDVTVVSKTGIPLSYNVTVDPDTDFESDELITVVVNVDDLDVPPHSMIPSQWSFTTAPIGPGTVILHPSDIASNPGEFSVMNGSWSTVLDTNDGDGSYVHKCCGPPFYEFYVDMDDPMGLEGTTIDNLTIYVYARYVDGSWPNAVPYAGNINIGYKTGTATVWQGNTTTDISGEYNLVISDTFTTDSDGDPLDLTDIMNLQIPIRRASLGPCQLRVTEIYAEVTYTP